MVRRFALHLIFCHHCHCLCLDDELEDNDTLDDHVWDSDEAEGGQGSGDSDPNKDSGSGGKKSDEG